MKTLLAIDFGSSAFLPHGHCYLWTPWLLGLYTFADGLIALAYFSIPFVLIYAVRKRPDIQLRWVMILFASFILACGSTHLVSVWIIWHPDYWLDVALRVLTALLSVATAIALWPVLPAVLRLPSPAQLQGVIETLEREVTERRAAESRLEQLTEIQELRVGERTAELVIINHRLQAEVILRKSAEERFRKLVEHSPVAKLMVSATGTIEMVNAQAERIFARPRSELLGMSIEALMPAVHRQAHPKLRAEYFSDPSSRPMGLGRDLHAVRGDGTEFPVEIGLNPIDTDEGLKVLSAIVDISERKQREARLNAAIEERNVLLREVHHRVKNNLQVIESLLAIGFDQFSDPKIHTMLDDCRGRVRTMALIHQTLYESENFSRVDFSAVLHHLVPTMINSYVTVPHSIDVAVNATGIELSIRRAIPCALLINELITNALKHAYPDGPPGRIEVDFDREPGSGELVLAVRDRGRGLPPDFDIDRVETVGMQLVRLLAAQIGGRLTIHLKQPTMFRVVFHDREG